MGSVVDSKALYNLGYGLYVLTTCDGYKDNGCIVNTVMQITGDPLRVVVGVNKQNYSNDIILKTNKFNINCLTVDAPFEIFKHFGFQSGRDVDKFAKKNPRRSDNNIAVITEYTNAYLSLEVDTLTCLGSHYMYVCSVKEAKVLSNKESMTYSYYQKNVKPKPEAIQNSYYVCKICGYIHKGETLPEDFVCPICKHGASDFEQVKQGGK